MHLTNPNQLFYYILVSVKFRGSEIILVLIQSTRTTPGQQMFKHKGIWSIFIIVTSVNLYLNCSFIDCPINLDLSN